MDTNLKSALDCLRDIKREDFDAQKELNSVKDEIAATRRKLAALEEQRKEMTKRKINALFQNLPSALRRYSAAWSLPFFEMFQERLPRELRDMVYAHIWDSKTVADTNNSMIAIMSSGCRFSPQDCEHNMTTFVESDAIDSCQHNLVPYFIKPAFVGQDSALEIVEAWYGCLTRGNTSIAMGVPLAEISSFLHQDRFHVGLKPAVTLRRLAVCLNADEFIADLEKNPIDEEGYRQYFKTLLSIKNKRGFTLTIRVLQKYVRLNVWQRIFDMCRDIVAIFEKEGARVRVQFVYNSFHPRRVPKYDMLPGLRHPESNWREDAVRFFDDATRLCDIHRTYRIENNDDYDPTLHPDDGDTPYETDENIYSDEGDSDDTVENHRQDDRGHRPGALSPPHQYGSDFIQWKIDLLDDLDMEEREGIKDSYDYWADFDPPSWVGVSPEPEYVGGPGYDTESGSDWEDQNSIT